jgi:hypothetical protein
MADLVILSVRDTNKCLEFYQALGNGQYSEPKIYLFSNTLQSFSFTDSSNYLIDLDFDGAIDLVLLYQGDTGVPYL